MFKLNKTRIFLSPFILEIPLGNGWVLLFNKLNFSLVKVEEKLWTDLKMRIARGENVTVISEFSKVLEELNKRDFILYGSEEHFSEYMKRLSTILEYILNKIRFQHPALPLFINVTSRCNLACRYCYLSQKPGKDLTVDGADKIIRFINKTVNRLKGLIKEVGIVYFGGEPLLVFPSIKYLHAQIERLALESSLELNEYIITNGTLLDRKVIDELSSWNSKLGIQITLDGTKDYHDKLRVYKDGRGTFEDVYRGFLLMIEELGKRKDINIVLRCNVNDENFASVFELLEQIKRDVAHRVSRVSVNFSWIFPQQQYFIEYGGTFSYDFSAAQKLLLLYKAARKLGFKLSPLTIVQGPCIGKISYGYAIDEEGKVYKCPGLLYTDKYFATLGDDGDLKEDSKLQFANNYVSFLMQEKKCYLTCEYGSLCYGGCTVMHSCPNNYFKVFIPEYLKMLGEGL